MGHALGEEARIVEIQASIPPKISGPIEERDLRRCLSYKEVTEEVEWEARNKTNVDLFRYTYKSTVVPAKCTASQLTGISEDFCYWGKRVRGGVTLEDASKDWLDALRLHSDLTRKVILEQTKCGCTCLCRSTSCSRKKQMSTGLICRGGTRASRCTSCSKAPLTRGIPLDLPGSTTCCRILSTPPCTGRE